MKQYFGLALGLLAGTMIGAAAVTGLHAQAKPPVYLITEIDVTNPEAYAKEFAPAAQKTVQAAGARFAVIGGTAGVGAKPITSSIAPWLPWLAWAKNPNSDEISRPEHCHS